MSYLPNKLMEIVSLQKFVELGAFISHIESMYAIDLNHTLMRRQAQFRITSLYKQDPVVGDCLRFPRKYHVNLSVGKIAHSLRQLIKAMVLLEENYASKEKFYLLLDEISLYVYTLDLKELNDAGIYDRASFEEKYGFSWKK